MPEPEPCCAQPDPTWYSATPDRAALNEEAWKCLSCGTQLGFRPDLDREHTETKTHAVLEDFHESNLIYVSNGTMGLVIAENVANRCHAENRYDQWSILAFILEDLNLNTHGAFWQNRATRWLMGGEPIRNEQEALFGHV